MQPLRVKDWDRALVEFTAAALLDEEPNTKPALSKRLNEISCPGDATDPSWNIFFAVFRSNSLQCP